MIDNHKKWKKHFFAEITYTRMRSASTHNIAKKTKEEEGGKKRYIMLVYMKESSEIRIFQSPIGERKKERSGKWLRSFPGIASSSFSWREKNMADTKTAGR